MCVCVCVAHWTITDGGELAPHFHYITSLHRPRLSIRSHLYTLFAWLSKFYVQSGWERERERARATAISWWVSRVLRRNDNFDVWPNRTECITLDKPDHTGSLPLPFSCHSIEHTPSVCVYADIFLCVSAICECAKSHSSINFGHFLFSLLL